MVPMIELDELAATLEITSAALVALVGGGGKTTSLFGLGDQLRGTTILTTTTKMGAEQSHGYRVLVDPTDAALGEELDRSGRALVWKAADDRRAIGVSAEACDRWFGLADNVIVEADGSRKRPFKAPADHEPVVPARTTLLVACVGVGALGRRISDVCHRPDIVARLAGCEETDVLTPARAAVVLDSPNGSRKGLPPSAHFAVVVHRVEDEHRSALEELENELRDGTTLLAVRSHGARRATTRPL